MRPARYILKKMERSDDSQIADRMNQAVELMADRSYLYKIVAILGVVNLLIWSAILLVPTDVRQAFTKVNDVEPKIVIVLFSFLFGLGLFFAYGVLRLKFPDIEDVVLENDPMQSFHYQASSNKRWFVWLFATIAAISNLLLMVIVDIWLSGD